jgi:peptidoglycan/LPS O-acetylase OafA/YrhL
LLRFVAVAAVVLYHFGFWGPASHGLPQVAFPWMGPFAQYGFLGVPVFFIISGFVIAYSAEGRTAAGFAIARFSRIYPTFVLCMTLAFLTILTLGAPYFEVTLAQWCANLFVAAPALGEQYVDTSYWSLVIEIVFYVWVATFMAIGLFPRSIDAIILIWLTITFANELTIDTPLIEKVFIADDSGFFAVGLLIYEFYRGRRDARLYGMFIFAASTEVFQAVHKLERLGVHTGGTFDARVVAAICVASIVVIFLASRVRRVPLPAGVVVALGGMTYPLYLLHMQMGYVFYTAVTTAQKGLLVGTILSAITVTSWAIWRYFERPAQRWSRKHLTGYAARLGWSVRDQCEAASVEAKKPIT